MYHTIVKPTDGTFVSIVGSDFVHRLLTDGQLSEVSVGRLVAQHFCIQMYVGTLLWRNQRKIAGILQYLLDIKEGVLQVIM